MSYFPNPAIGGAGVTVAAGDHICLACMNQTDATIVGMNLRVLRYRR